MNVDKINKAVKAAQEFLARVDELARIEARQPWHNPKQSGALRRQSMELTRALAEMRKP